jgi:hypothetical protein
VWGWTPSVLAARCRLRSSKNDRYLSSADPCQCVVNHPGSGQRAVDQRVGTLLAAHLLAHVDLAGVRLDPVAQLLERLRERGWLMRSIPLQCQTRKPRPLSGSRAKQAAARRNLFRGGATCDAPKAPRKGSPA